MAKLRVNGGRRLAGEVMPSANKNAVLPVLCATLLTDEAVTLRNVPDITDVRKILDYFRSIGSAVEADFATGVVALRHGGDLDARAARLPAGMRSTIMLIPALLRRFGQVMLEDDSKGCTLGMREIDPHVEVLRAFGATVSLRPEGVVIEAPKAFTPARHWLDYASVTTTENFLMCALLAPGRSRLTNAACEPHVQEFSRFLTLMGARIEAGAGTLEVDGGRPLGGADYTFADDFHEVATFLALSALTGGGLRVRNGVPDQFQLLDRTFAKFGVTITHADGWSTASGGPMKVQRPFTAHMMQKVEAAPWPYVPADLLPIFIALGVRAEGSVMFWNKVYEGALGWTSELTKFGAQVMAADPHRVITFGGQPLSPATDVESPYIIRAAIALLLVAIGVEGQSVIDNADPIRRAHPDFVENLSKLGADIRWE
jgi:UDP-N-acetylglucosamine 1-carboxyvinyltransferase